MIFVLLLQLYNYFTHNTEWRLMTMDNQWFYIRKWKQKAWERLLEHRTVRVSWDTAEEDQREFLPKYVTLPPEVELTNEGICNYLSNTFGWSVKDWMVADQKE